MIRYKNIFGYSGVRAYEIGDDFIRFEFSSADVYVYTYESAGWANIEQMKFLANWGRGLNTFINYAAKDRFTRRER